MNFNYWTSCSMTNLHKRNFTTLYRSHLAKNVTSGMKETTKSRFILNCTIWITGSDNDSEWSLDQEIQSRNERGNEHTHPLLVMIRLFAGCALNGTFAASWSSSPRASNRVNNSRSRFRRSCTFRYEKDESVCEISAH